MQSVKPYGSSSELNSTVLSVVPGPLLSWNRHVILQYFMFVLPKLLIIADFEIRRLEIFLKINSDQTVGIHDNFKCKVLLLRIIVKSETYNEFIPIREEVTLIGGKIFHFELNHIVL
jgi:hypothetical protein